MTNHQIIEDFCFGQEFKVRIEEVTWNAFSWASKVEATFFFCKATVKLSFILLKGFIFECFYCANAI